jgi:hypothetical protein
MSQIVITDGTTVRLIPPLATMATMPVSPAPMPAPIPAPVHSAWLLPRLPNRWRARSWRTSAELDVYPLVDLRTNPIDQAFCDRAVIVAAKFVMRCCSGSDVVPPTRYRTISTRRTQAL